MANEEHLAILRQGVEVWNKWREENPDVRPDLNGARLVGADLHKINLHEADLSWADLRRADLRRADLALAELIEADLSGADLRGADLIGTLLIGTLLIGTDLSAARLGDSVFADNDLSEVKGLDTTRHGGPSDISIGALVRSKGKIPRSSSRAAVFQMASSNTFPRSLGPCNPSSSTPASSAIAPKMKTLRAGFIHGCVIIISVSGLLMKT
jgi:hypothetical protein